jgi:O-acetyl-ADP-ribose deacetylase (regulator of RNase III)
MRYKTVMGMRAIQADIVTLDVDAIVNAANASLLGVFGYPAASAAEIAVTTVRDALSVGGQPSEVVFCCFSRDDLSIYEGLLGA